MLRSRRFLGFVVVLSATFLLNGQTLAQSAANTTQAAGHKAKPHAKKPAPVAEAPQVPPPPPPTLEEQAPISPQITYRDGQLSITSINATLAQVLHSVQTQTGATIDLPPGAGSERVVATLGPGKPQAVLASLLNGSKFNYLILGAPDNPGTVQRVILLAKSNSTGSEPAVASAQVNPRVPLPQAVEPPEDEYPPNEPEVNNEPPQMQPVAPGGENVAPDGSQLNNNRTPEQMLQELQRMQQQQQQMQQQLNPSNQPSQPFGTPFNPNQQPQQSPFPNQAQPSPQPQ